MTDEAHEHGALAGVELWHGGVHAEAARVAAGPARPVADRERPRRVVVPKAMELRRHPARRRAEWVAAARARARAGFDIVYVYGSHSYLPIAVPLAVLQPAHRRVRRLAREPGAVLAGDARAGAGRRRRRLRDRASASPSTRSGRRACRVEEGLALHRAWPTTWSTCGTSTIGVDGRAGGVDSGAVALLRRRAISWSGPAESARRPDKPIVGVGRFTDPDTMADVVARRRLDIIGAARPSIADPFLPRKIEEGRYDEIRECIGCNVCYSRLELRQPPRLHAERDRRRGVPPRLASRAFTRAANADRDVLVVGAGPAGHGVRDRARQARHATRCTWSTRRDEIGGSMRWIPRLPGLGEWGRVIDYRRRPARPAARTSRSSLEPALDAADVLDYGAEHRRRRDRVRTGPATASAASRAGRSRAPTRRSRTCSRPSRSCSRASGRPAPGRRVRLRGVLHGRRRSPSCSRGEGYEVDARHPPRSGRACLRRDARGPAAAPAAARDRRRDAHRERSRSRSPRAAAASADGEFGDPVALETDGVVLVTQRHLRRRALPRACAAPGGARRGRHRGGLPHRRLRRPAAARRRDLRRPPPRPRDRLRGSGAPLPYLRERPLVG